MQDGVVEEDGVLGHNSHVGAQGGLRDLAYVLPVDPNHPGGGVVEAEQQPQRAGFSAACASKQASQRAAMCCHVRTFAVRCMRICMLLRCHVPRHFLLELVAYFRGKPSRTTVAGSCEPGAALVKVPGLSRSPVAPTRARVWPPGQKNEMPLTTGESVW